jgi:hypothetical protein
LRAGLVKLALLLFVACAGVKPQKDPLDRQLGNIYQCYLESDLYARRQNGVIVVSFDVRPNGSVDDARPDHVDYKDANLTACVLGRLRMVKYPGALPRQTKTIELSR